MNKTCFILWCLFSLFTHVSLRAKDSNGTNRKSDKYLQGIGFGAFGEAGTMTRYAQYRVNNGYDAEFLGTVGRPVCFSFLYAGVNNHFMVKSFGSEKSLSINFYPTIGLSYTAGRLLNITAPVMFCYNMGKLSTSISEKNTGLTFGIGMEYIKAGIVSILGSRFQTEYIEAFKANGIIQPCAAIGLRYLSRDKHSQEINFKYGMNRSLTTKDYGGQLPLNKNIPSTNFWFRLTLVRYING